MFAEIDPGEVLVPSPLLTETSKHILLHFQFGPDGKLTSPQAPTGNMRDLAESGYTTTERIEAAVSRLAALKKRLDRKALLAALPGHGVPQAQVMVQHDEPNEAAQPAAPGPAQQAQRSVSEYQARFRSFQQAANVQPEETIPKASKLVPVTEAVLRPLWFGDALVLARRVEASGGGYLQGCWLDWPSLEKWLLEDIHDLLPDARLEPLQGETGDPRARVLASLPARLLPGATVAEAIALLSPVRLSLLIAWGCLIVAGGAVALLLVGAISLSERRAAFVSAVTHELRTPLTTFQLYSEMLAEGMVADEAKRRSYLQTLCVEADRLSHLVENVLAYARLERGSVKGRAESIPVASLLARAQARLAHRAEQAGMSLEVEAGEGTDALAVRADPAAVEQILLNLVDNACKYAASADDKRIHLDLVRSAGFSPYLDLRVRDHGPGVAADARQRLFRPFSKSARDAAHSKPGVGLGLALSRQLARDMGGDLTLDDTVGDGACFVLTLPCA